jgi:peroxiredoxin
LVHRLLFDNTGRLTRSEFEIPNSQGMRLVANYEDQRFGRDTGRLEFPTAAPRGYTDLTDLLTKTFRDPAKVLEGKVAPDFSLPTLGGGSVTLSEQRGKVVVLDFWATWCAPCRDALPQLQAISDEMSDQPVVVWAMNMDDGKRREQQVSAFTRRHGITLPQIVVEGDAVPSSYAVMGIPTTVVIRPDGVVHRVFSGYAPGAEEHVRQAIGEALLTLDR